MFKKIKANLLYFIMKKVGKNIDLKKLEPVPTFPNKIINFLLKPFIDRNALNKIILGPISFKLLHSGYNLGLFHYLANSPGATLSEISTQLNIELYPTEILLNGLEALKLVQKTRDDRYYNCLPSMLLAQDFNDKFLFKLMNYMDHILMPAMSELQSAIAENKPKGLHKIFGEDAQDYYYELSKNEKYSQCFVPFMAAFSQINIDAVAKYPIFSKINRLLDIGGSEGEMAMSIAKYHPSIHITVYDHPSTTQLAMKRFQENNLDHRLNVIGGNFLNDDLPVGYDGMLFSHVIDIFSDDTNKILFKKAFERMGDNGKIIIFTPIVHGDHDNSYTYKIYNAYFLCLANGRGQFYVPHKIIDWVKEAGFSQVEIEYLPCNEILITGTKPVATRSLHARKYQAEKTGVPV